MDFNPANPDYAVRVRDSFGRQAFMALIGGRVEDVGPGHCRLRLPHVAHLDQHRAHLHGGVIASLADTAAGYAAFSLAPTDASILTVEFKINFLTSARGDALVAEGNVLRSGKSLTVCEARVYDESDGQRTLCAVVLETLMLLPGRADSQDAERPVTKRRSPYLPSAPNGALKPSTEQFATHVADVLDGQPFSKLLGVELEAVEPGFAVNKLEHRNDVTQQHGFFHGGVVATIADLAMGTAAGSLVPPSMIPVTAEFKLNLMAPGDGHRLKGYGYVVRPGRTVSICRADVTTVDTNGTEVLCALALGTLVPIAV